VAPGTRPPGPVAPWFFFGHGFRFSLIASTGTSRCANRRNPQTADTGALALLTCGIPAEHTGNTHLVRGHGGSRRAVRHVGALGVPERI